MNVSAVDVAIPMDTEKKDNADMALLDDSIEVTPERYPISELAQFYIILKRALLFSRRDWVGREKKNFKRTKVSYFQSSSSSLT